MGGYFGLDLPDYGEIYPQAIRYQSARAALKAVFECPHIHGAWIPSYICDSVLQAAEAAGVQIHLYALNTDLSPSDLPKRLSEGDVVLYVNYFGLCQSVVNQLQTHYLPEQLIIDNSHALFAPHGGNLATVYSPRKFAGLPDGGLLLHSSALQISAPEMEDTLSFERMKFLLLRTAHSAREGYAAFNEARNSLNNLPPQRMSRLTRRLMRSINWPEVADCRRKNFSIMDNLMMGHNASRWVVNHEDIPLCYPLFLPRQDVGKIKSKLAEQNIFTATYWPDVLPRLYPNSAEASLTQNTLFLPIDQRLNSAETGNMGRRILHLLQNPTA